MFYYIINFFKYLNDENNIEYYEISIHFLNMLFTTIGTIALIIIAIYLIKIYKKMKRGK